MSPRAFLVAIVRESRGARGRLFFFVACLALGVAAIVGVSALVEAVRAGIRAQSRELLGADLSISAFRPLPDELALQHDAFDIQCERTDVRELATMASSSRSGRSQLVEVKAVGGRFPFYGALGLEPAGALEELLTPDTCVVAPELLSAGTLALGDALTIGAATYRIAGIVRDEPGRLGLAFTAGPRVFLSLDGLARAELERVGSRLRHRALYRYQDERALPGGDVDAWAQALAKQHLEDAQYLRFESYREPQPTVARAIGRVERYLGLVALLSLILGGIGVAMIVRAWIAERTAAVAVLRCLGFRPREVLLLYAGNVVLLAAVASLLGGLVGSCLPLVIERWLVDLLPAGVTLRWEPLSILRGVGLGVGIALVFSLPPLIAIWRVAPARVLRQEAEPLPVPPAVRWSAFLVLALGLFAAAWAQSADLRHAAAFTAGLALLAAFLAACAFGLTRLAARLPRARLNPYFIHGVAALARPGAGVLGAAIALGFGVLVVLAMALSERELSRKLGNALPPDAPSTFLVDVQPDQWSAVEGVLERHGATSIDHVPVVTARLKSIDGRDVGGARGDDEGRGRWALTREQRLTWRAELPSSNRLVAGTWWTAGEDRELSVEEQFAEDIGATLGSELVFDLQGVPVAFRVTSLRSVEWESFQINFFLVAEPGPLDAAPHMLFGAARVDPGVEDALQDELARSAPNVTLMRMRAILEKVRGVLERLGLAVRVLGLFTVITGLVILAGVASTTALRRGREVALLKTLGVTRLGVTALFTTEFALLGLVAGLVGGCAAFALAFAFLDQVLELGPDLPWLWLPLAAVLTAVLAAASGLAATARALEARPIESLRSS